MCTKKHVQYLYRFIYQQKYHFNHKQLCFRTTYKVGFLQQVDCDVQMKMGKKKQHTNDLRIPPCFSLCIVLTIRTSQVLVCSFLGCFIFFLCHTPNLLSVRPKWLQLPASLNSIHSISSPASSLHPAAVSSPAGLFALKYNDVLHQFLQSAAEQSWDSIFAVFLIRHSIESQAYK